MKTRGYLLVGMVLVATPANGQLIGSRNYPELPPPRIQFDGEACQVGGEITACPKLPVDLLSEGYFEDLLHDRYKRDVTVSFCVKENGRVNDEVIISDTSGGDRDHDELLRGMGYLRFHPGAINGKPAKMCGFTSLFQFRPRKWSDRK